MQKIISGYLLIMFFILSCNDSKKKEETARVDTLPFFNEASFTPKWLQPKSKKLKSFHKIPNFEFVNQNGEKVTQETFKDKIYVTDFFFTTCPGICPMMTSNMYKLQEAFKNDDDILLLSHSVTPEKDSIARLKDYAIEHKIIDEKWHLVTGKRKKIYDLGRKFYFVDENLGEPKGVDDFLHTENFVLVDKNRHIRGIYNGLNRASIAQLIVDIKQLKKEN